MIADHGCRFEVQERVVTARKGEADVPLNQKLLVQKKADAFDAGEYARVMAFTAEHAPRFEPANKIVVMKEGVPFNHATHSTVKQKLLYNKEKKLLKKIEDTLAQKQAAESLAKFSSSFTKFRVKIPDLVYFEADLERQKGLLFSLINDAYEIALKGVMAKLKPGQDAIELKRGRPHSENMFRLNDQGELNNYVILFFNDETLAQEFCNLLTNQIFNKSVLKPEILQNK